MKPVYKFLKEARALVDANWIKGTYKSGESYCAIGAVEEIDDREYEKAGYTNRIRPTASKRLREALPRGYTSVVAFNDAKKTTKQDVLDLFTRAMRASR